MRAVSTKILCLAVILVLTVLIPVRVKAGVVILQRVTISSPGEPGAVHNRTLMVQGDKERFTLGDHSSIVFDADNRIATMIDSLNRVFRQLPLNRLIGTSLDPNRVFYTAFKSTDKTHNLLGFKCRDYKGVSDYGPTLAATTVCFSTSAVGAGDFSHFLKLIAGQSQHPEQANLIPVGLPLNIESTRLGNPAFPLGDISAQDAARMRSTIARIPHQVEQVVVMKVTSEKLSPEVFNPPPGYSRRGPIPN
jgi:hypothetical protein